MNDENTRTESSETRPAARLHPRVVTVALALVIAASFAYHVHRYYFLGDDCFISFRYARNLVEGHGLVFNPGERVEGYTNFLWAMLMAGAMKAGLAPEIVSNVLGIASGAVILGTLVWFGARRTGWSDPLIWLAPLCLAMNRSFCGWSTSGLEMQFFSMLAWLSLLALLSERRRRSNVPILSALLLALTTLTRPDGGIFFAVAAAFFFVDCVRGIRRWRGLVIWLIPYAVLVGSHVAWRYSYYGALLPNTFYAKVSGFWWEQSSMWLGAFLKDYMLYLFIPLCVVVIASRQDSPTILFTGVLFAQLAYLVYVGGDQFEYRLLLPVLPYLYWLIQEGLREAGTRLADVGVPRMVTGVMQVFVSLLLVGATYIPNTMTPSVWEKGLTVLESIGNYADRRSDEGRFLRGLVEKGALRGDELIAVRGAGALPYYSRLPTLDFHGLNDTTISRQHIEHRGMIGHEKRASLEYLRQRRVVIFEAFNQIVFPAEFEVRQYRGALDADLNLPIRCLRIDDRYLLFATTLPEWEFLRVFRQFEIVY